MSRVDPVLNKLASTCGTRFIHNRVGRVVTKHPLAWKSAFWLQLALKEHGYSSTYTETIGEDHLFHIYAEKQEEQETMSKNIEVVLYGTGRSYYVRVDGRVLRTKNGKGPRLFRSASAARRTGLMLVKITEADEKDCS